MLGRAQILHFSSFLDDMSLETQLISIAPGPKDSLPGLGLHEVHGRVEVVQHVLGLAHGLGVGQLGIKAKSIKAAPKEIQIRQEITKLYADQ